MSEAMQPGPLSDLYIFTLEGFLIIIAVEFPGIYSALVIIVLYKLWTNKARLAAHHILIAASISMFVANVFGATITRLNYLIGDSIVVWRAWVLWTNHSRVHMLLCICLFGTFVGVTVDLVFAVLFELSRFSDTPRFPPTGQRTLILTLPLFLTNLISTLLIAYKVWKYRVETKQNLGLSHNKRNKVERVLILLTESGSIYCLLWLGALVFGFKSSDEQSLSYALISNIIPQLVIYPILIILLVTLEKANLESTITGPSFSQSLQFASRPQVPTATDDVTPDSTTGHIDSVMLDLATDDRLDPTTDDGPDSNTNDFGVAEPTGERMGKHNSSHFK
ncbi:hypothetical protein C8J56DRAFT_1046645 [Mycena floridula]|nr:hypothetical protein C8J56DRAFT_1046645 [Mycena floridula]